jgi:hypothetical protein
MKIRDISGQRYNHLTLRGRPGGGFTFSPPGGAGGGTMSDADGAG